MQPRKGVRHTDLQKLPHRAARGKMVLDFLDEVQHDDGTFDEV